MQVLIVDDEPLAQEILEAYVLKTPGLRLAGKCANALEAFTIINDRQVDLLLLDINMPEMSGVDLLHSLRHIPPTIFTTAYPEYAIAGYELDVVDYLLKPIPYDRFLKAIQKARNISPATRPGAPLMDAQQPDILFVRSEGRLMRIRLGELAIVEGLKDYLRFWAGSAKVVVYGTMKSVEKMLVTHPSFVRINKSYIVNLAHVTEIDGNCMVIRDQRLVIGATYREPVMEIISRFKFM